MLRSARPPTSLTATLLLAFALGTSCASAEAPPAAGRPPGPRPAPPGPAERPSAELSLASLRRGTFAGVLHGAGPLWDREEFVAYQQALTGTPPLLMSLGVNVRLGGRYSWAALLERVEDELIANPGLIPLLTIDFVRKNEDGEVEGLDGDVVQGRHDRRLTHVAQLVKRDGRPFFVRVAAECNGEWNGYDPRTFPDAFRHVVALFRKVGADNAIFVWNVKLVVPDVPPYMAFYPGDEWVDWWSLDLFAEDILVTNKRAAVTAFLKRARQAGKPVMIPEACPSGMDLREQDVWQRWFTPFFAIVLRDATVKAFVYSSRDYAAKDATLRHWGDMRIDRAAVLPEYQAMLRDPRFLHQPAGAPFTRPDDVERLVPRAAGRGASGEGGARR